MHATAWIVTATLDERQGAATLEQAWRTAGVSAHRFVSIDARREGGVKTANRALRYAQGTPYVCYINDDVSFPQQGWLGRLIEALEEHPRNGAAGPSGNCGTQPQQSGRRGLPPKVVPVERLSFFVVVFKRAVLEQVGYLDERFIHYGCDGDYCLRMQQAGWQPVWVQDVWVEHRRSPTKRDWKAHDVAEFKKKWHKRDRS